jgi:hypothetical protein
MKIKYEIDPDQPAVIVLVFMAGQDQSLYYFLFFLERCVYD